ATVPSDSADGSTANRQDDPSKRAVSAPSLRFARLAKCRRTGGARARVVPDTAPGAVARRRGAVCARLIPSPEDRDRQRSALHEPLHPHWFAKGQLDEGGGQR